MSPTAALFFVVITASVCASAALPLLSDLDCSNQTITCVGEGSVCSFGDPKNPIVCRMGLACILDPKTPGNGTCKDVDDFVGTNCTSRDECSADMYPLDCVGPAANQQCQYVDWAAPGEACHVDADCIGRRACLNATCEFIPEGQACIDGKRDCANGFYCSHHAVCTRYVALGQSCVVGTVESPCGPFVECLPVDTPNNTVCVYPTYDLDEGAACSFEKGCKAGYFCNLSIISPKCVKYNTSVGASCISDAGCTVSAGAPYEACECNPTEVFSNSTGMCTDFGKDACFNEFHEFLTCLKDHGCYSAPDFTSPVIPPKSCAGLHCQSKFNDAANCYYKHIFPNQEYADAISPCLLPSSNLLWIIIIVAVVAAIILVVLVVVVVVVVRKRSRYQSID